MSFSKKDHIWSSAITDKELALLIQKILRQEYQNKSAAIKHIGLKTGVELRTIRNWYEGRNPPKSIHLLHLANHYPKILEQVIRLIGCSDLWALYEQRTGTLPVASDDAENSPAARIYSAKFCTINVTLDIDMVRKLNQRQLWYLGLLQQGHKMKAGDIVAVWEVSDRTAKYDVEGLVDLRLINFIGSRKNGYYMPT